MPHLQHPVTGVLTHLGDIPVEQFLTEYWQQKPLLIRQAFPRFQSPVSPEELAGFALEEGVESRLVLERPTADSLQSVWELEHGPLPEDRFNRLPESHWTLLVQAVDQLVPEVAELLNRFRFIPNWRLDDIMVSYATDQGGVGPHFDYYDVFLLQAQGRRLWRLGQRCDSHSPMRGDAAMRILAEFQQREEYLLEPGDMLYIPPHIAHWGLAEGSCMTYSVGFRAPSYSDLLLDFSTEVAAQLDPDQRYADADVRLPDHPGEITTSAIERVQAILTELTRNRKQIARWLAAYGTSSKRTAPEQDSPAVPDAGEKSQRVALKLRVRSAYVPEESDRALLYLDGECHLCSLTLAQALSGYRPFDRSAFQQSDDQQLLTELIEDACLTAHD